MWDEDEDEATGVQLFKVAQVGAVTAASAVTLTVAAALVHALGRHPQKLLSSSATAARLLISPYTSGMLPFRLLPFTRSVVRVVNVRQLMGSVPLRLQLCMSNSVSDDIAVHDAGSEPSMSAPYARNTCRFVSALHEAGTVAVTCDSLKSANTRLVSAAHDAGSDPPTFVAAMEKCWSRDSAYQLGGSVSPRPMLSEKSSLVTITSEPVTPDGIAGSAPRTPWSARSTSTPAAVHVTKSHVQKFEHDQREVTGYMLSVKAIKKLRVAVTWAAV